MKRIFLLLFIIISLNLDAQYIVNYAQNVEQSDIDGFYYNLPNNVIRLDFVVEQTQFEKGKYADYAEELLGVDSYIKDNSIKYRIRSVDAKVMLGTDEEMVFFVSADEKVKDAVDFSMELTPVGTVKSFGVEDNFEISSNDVVLNKEIKSDEPQTFYHYIQLNDDEEELEDDEENDAPKAKPSDKETALSVVEEIKKVRQAYFDLISGYQEVNYGNTMNLMLDELKKLECEYLNLFVGKTSTSCYTETFYVMPEVGTNNYVVSKFSETDGFNAKAGDVVKLSLQDIKSSNVKGISEETVKNTTYVNKIVHREPADVNVKLMIGEDMILDDRIYINQLGNYILLPINKMQLRFDPNNGRLVSVVKG